MVKYYDYEHYIPHLHGRGLKALLVRFVQTIRTIQRRHMVEQNSPAAGILLDIGCGSGKLAGSLKKRGWQTYGIEPQPVMQKHIQQKKPLTLLQWDELNTLQPQSIDCIVLWHSLEHLHQPAATLRAITQLLAPHGHIYIALPNIDCLQAKQYGTRWVGYDVPRHISHFTPCTLKAALATSKLKIRALQPIHLETYIFAALSERSPLMWWRALLRGLQQHVASIQCPTNAPSIMFHIQHAQ
jgi:2-polyprenyl-3-methyl-5-hydroxy-6-metoxy-1,4-benzoquinol methylase